MSLPCSPAAPPLEDDNLLAEILLRLPPLPSSLPRASAVSKRWHSLASDARFSRRFRAHHRRNPPLLGCFIRDTSRDLFQPALEAPNRVPEGRFSFPIDDVDHCLPFGCRHGLMLILDSSRGMLLVWDPVTGDQHCLDAPPVFGTRTSISSAVLRTTEDVRYFQVVLVGSNVEHRRVVASVYSSETGVWGNLISSPLDDTCRSASASFHPCMPAVMVGRSLYWLFPGDPHEILEFDLDRQSLDLIPTPWEVTRRVHLGQMWVIPAERGGLGFLFLSGFSAQLSKRKTNSDGVVASWALERTIALDILLSINPEERGPLLIIGFAEANNVVLLWTSIGIFTVQLESLQFKKVFQSGCMNYFYPFEVVYTADKGISGGHDEAQLLQNT